MKFKKTAISYIGITFGVITMAFSVLLFIKANKIVPGGITGLANIIHHVFGFKLGTATLFLSIPIFLIGVLTLGKTTGIKTLYCNILYAATIDVLGPFVHVVTKDLFLASIFGGVLMGAGLGIMLGFGGSLGGTDLSAKILHKYLPNVPIQWHMFGIDFAVILVGGIIFGPEIALFSIVNIFVATKVIDVIQEGANYGKSIFIISEKSDAIAGAIMKQLGRGVTAFHGKGMYTKTEKDVLFCIVRRPQIVPLKKLVMEIDPNAFISIGDMREVVGKGFSEEKLFS